MTNQKHARLGNVGNFVMAYPVDNDRVMKKWNRMIEYVGKMPTELRSKYLLPEMLKRKSKEPNTMDTSITEFEDKEREMEMDNILDNDTIAAAEAEDDEVFAQIDERERLAAEENDAKLKARKSKKSSRKNSGKSSKKNSAKGSKRSSRKPSPGDEKPVEVEIPKKDDDPIRSKSQKLPPPPHPVDEEDVPEKIKPKKSGSRKGTKKS